MRFALVPAALCVVAMFSSCSPHVGGINVVDQFKKDTTAIQAYISQKGIPATKLSQGIWFVYDQASAGPRAQFVDTAVLVYKLRLLPSETVVEDYSAAQANYNVANLPTGAQIALPLFPKGSKGRIFMPSYYGYQNQAVGNTPANSNLIFEFSVVDVIDHHLKGDTAQINNYLTTNKINALSDPSGVRYTVDSLGTGQLVPQLTDSIAFKYTVKLFDGSTIQQQATPVKFLLSDLILAWKIALPLVPEGSVITIYAPSSYAYGPNPAGTLILPNTNLIFNVKLVKVSHH